MKFQAITNDTDFRKVLVRWPALRRGLTFNLKKKLGAKPKYSWFLLQLGSKAILGTAQPGSSLALS